MRIDARQNLLLTAMRLAEALGIHNLEGSAVTSDTVTIHTRPDIMETQTAKRLANVFVAALRGVSVEVTSGDPKFDLDRLRLEANNRLPSARCLIALDAIIQDDPTVFDISPGCAAAGTRDMLIREVYNAFSQPEIDHMRHLWEQVK